MSSSSPLSTPSKKLSDIFQAMNKETPTGPSLTAAQKRDHAAMVGAENSDNDDGRVPALALPNQNTINTVKHYAERKRLRGEQTTEATNFVQDTDAVRDTKLFINLLHLSNVLGKIVTSAPPYSVSPALEKNLHDFATAVLLSSKISAYKVSLLTRTQDIVKKHRFDLPVGIENNPADFAKVIAAVREAFTQLRSKFKKALHNSLNLHKGDNANAPGPKQQNIFKLTQILVKGTQCSVSCARVALMRKTYLKDPSLKFWDTLDNDLAEIRTEAKGNAKKIARAFRHILTQDQAKHGVKDYKITEDAVNDFQQTVNDLIEAGAADVASAPATMSSETDLFNVYKLAADVPDNPWLSMVGHLNEQRAAPQAETARPRVGGNRITWEWLQAIPRRECLWQNSCW
ncbi:hypothetical protein B0H10DRAFT_1948115 [Mycena sp. CBHHK59/15]|nr:hypothetical protein B0H10DRAFT_1948115 [Mycena sp. CBHHK59/15]